MYAKPVLGECWTSIPRRADAILWGSRLGSGQPTRARRLIDSEITHLHYSYDAAGRVNSLTQPGSGPATYTVSHDGAGDLTTLLAPNGGQATWSYDPAGRISGTTWISGTTSLFTQTVTLDAAGQRLQSADSWGTSSYGYDQDGRLTSASYPDGSSEANQYDAGGNRTVITSSTPLSGTSVLTNTYDLADELTGSAGTQGNTTYTYDGNGNQIGSIGPTGAVSNAYNDLGQLTQVQGPTTNVSYVYDGQGDRLRSYEQYGPTPVLTNDVQDLAGGLSDLVSDGTVDYTYLEPGTGAAPVAAYNQSTTRSTYLATDLLGSVRLATDPTGAMIGAGAYGAWGVYRPYQGTNGPTQLAGLRASSPFGYAGQYYDSGPGTYSMRARQYDPAQDRFLSQDPQSYAPQVPVTLNPYEYAGNMVTGITDPSGKGWVYPDPTIPFGDYQQQSIIGGQALGSNQVRYASDLGLLWRALGVNSTTQSDWVPVLKHPPSCGHVSPWTPASLSLNTDNANVIDLPTHQYWDIEHANAYSSGLSGRLSQIVQHARTNGILWPDGACNHFAQIGQCAGTVRTDPSLKLGNGFPPGHLPANAQRFDLAPGVPAVLLSLGQLDHAILVWQPQAGLLLYAVVPVRVQPLCVGLLGCFCMGPPTCWSSTTSARRSEPTSPGMTASWAGWASWATSSSWPSWPRRGVWRASSPAWERRRARRGARRRRGATCARSLTAPMPPRRAYAVAASRRGRR